MGKSKFVLLTVIAVYLICFASGLYIGFITGGYLDSRMVHKVDTVYDAAILDSIEYNISKRDSEVVVLKEKIEYEKNKALAANDSVAVEQFKQLVTEHEKQ